MSTNLSTKQSNDFKFRLAAVIAFPIFVIVISIVLINILPAISTSQIENRAEDLIKIDCYDKETYTTEIKDGGSRGSCFPDDIKVKYAVARAEQRMAVKNFVIAADGLLIIMFIVAMLLFGQKSNMPSYDELNSSTRNLTFDFIDKTYALDAEARNSTIAKYALHYKTITTYRIHGYISDLHHQSKTNLFIASLPAIILVTIFGYILWLLLRPLVGDESNPITESELKQVTLIVLFVGVFLQTLSFFLLQNYRRIRSDIRFYQNELSNIELWYGALSTALIYKDGTTVKAIIDSLSKSERNFLAKEEKVMYPDDKNQDSNNGAIWKAFFEKFSS